MISRLFTRLAKEHNPLRFLISRILWHSRLCYLFRIKKDGYKLHFFPTAMSASLWAQPKDRDADVTFVQNTVGPGDRVIDVGANIGQLAVAAGKRAGPSGRVYAFEPHPTTFAYLKKNVELNKLENIRSFQNGLGDENTEASITSHRSDDQNRVLQAGGGTPITLRRLDDVDGIGEEEKIRLLKIDVEGFELHVLKGAPLTLAKTQIVYFESSPLSMSHFGVPAEAILTLLRDSGMQIFTLQAHTQSFHPVTETLDNTDFKNLIAAKDISLIDSRR